MAGEQGKKNDTGKLRFDLIPVEPLRKVAEVYSIGSRKYVDRNWEKGLQWGRVFAALQRHAWAFWNGEQVDKDDGQHHLASVVWCALALMEYERTHKELDDRPTTKPKKYYLDGSEQLPDSLGDDATQKSTATDDAILVRRTIPRQNYSFGTDIQQESPDSGTQDTTIRQPYQNSFQWDRDFGSRG